MRLLLVFTLLTLNLWGQTIKARKCGFAEQRFSINRENSLLTRDVPDLDEFYLSPDGSFRIHFTRSGPNAVSGSEVSGIPEFVIEAAIAADSAYTILVDKLGFLPPLPDDFDGPELDIYIKNWNGSVYAYTLWDGNYSSPYSGLPAYLVIDNDYVESSYATKGLDALRVTIAHEFFHMVQLRYAYPFEPVSSNAYWYEISSVWMEEVCYPDVNDYHAYVEDNFRQVNFPNLNDDSFGFSFSYGHGLFGQVLDVEFGEREGKHIMLDIWENLSDKEATDNLELVLESSPWNSSLTDALGKYSLYNVFTGSRAIDGSYYEDANQLSEIRTTEFLLPLSYPVLYDFDLAPLQMGFKKFSIQTMSDFFVRGEDLTEDQRVYLTYHSYDEGSSVKAAVGDPWIPCYNTSSQDYLIFPMTNGDRVENSMFSLSFEGSTLELDNVIQTLWPNPSILSDGPLHLNLMLSSPGTIKLKVYNILGQTIHQQSQFSPEGIRIVDLTLPENTPGGIYFVQLVAGEKAVSRKFTVLK